MVVIEFSIYPYHWNLRTIHPAKNTVICYFLLSRISCPFVLSFWPTGSAVGSNGRKENQPRRTKGSQPGQDMSREDDSYRRSELALSFFLSFLDSDTRHAILHLAVSVRLSVWNISVSQSPPWYSISFVFCFRDFSRCIDGRQESVNWRRSTEEHS